MPSQRIDTLRRHALGNGLIEAMVAWVIERYIPADKQIATRSQHCAIKLAKTLALLEADADLRNPDRFDLGDIAIATALAYIEFRKLQPGWVSQLSQNGRVVCAGVAAPVDGGAPDCRTADPSSHHGKHRHGKYSFGHRLEHGGPHRRPWQELH